MKMLTNTNDFVKNIPAKIWKIFFIIVFLSLFIGSITPSIYRHLTRTDLEKCTSKHDKRVERYFYDLDSVLVYGTFFKIKRSWFTAGHVITDANYNYPTLAPNSDKWEVMLRGLDIAVYNKKSIAKYEFSQPLGEINQGLVVMGYPAGSKTLRSIEAYTYIERSNGSNNWIGIIKPDEVGVNEPVVSGMSGGLVLEYGSDTCNPMGVLITMNSPVDLDPQNKNGNEQSFDFIGIKGALK